MSDTRVIAEYGTCVVTVRYMMYVQEKNVGIGILLYSFNVKNIKYAISA